ncbi:MAG: DUF916 domain-containing protein [Actinobacteria bacterium]|nr:DUF916 domain-containing protein [Actinomycetota bacterium]
MRRPFLPARRAAMLVLTVATGLFWLPAAPASAGFGIALRPGHFDPGDPSTKAYFKPTVAPGETFTDEVIVTNTGDTPIELVVSGVDGLTAPTSGAVYGNRQDPVTRAGAWVNAATSTVTIAPRAEVPVKFTVQVPKDAGAGDHVAGIAFEDAHPTSAGSNFAVTQIVRSVMGVQVVVPGPGAFAAHIDDATLQSLPGTSAASVLVKLGNNGARLGKPALSVALTGPKGYQRTVERTLDTVLPGDTIPYALAWPDVLEPGDYSISATATAPGGAPVVHTAATRLGAALAGVPSPGVVITPAPSPARHSSRSYPVWLAVVVLAAAIGGGAYVGRRSHRPKRPAEEPVLTSEGASQYSVDR